MHVLSRLPTDGTFHQTQPLDRIVNWKAYYSSDFTAATDRMPLRVSVIPCYGTLIREFVC